MESSAASGSYDALPILPDKWQYSLSKGKEKQFSILKS